MKIKFETMADPVFRARVESLDFDPDIAKRLVGPDRATKHHFFLRCKECGAQQSFISICLASLTPAGTAGLLTAFCVAHTYGRGSRR